MNEQTFKITVDHPISVTARQTHPEGSSGWMFVYAPGAGSHVDDPFGLFVSRRLATLGVVTVRFQFPYQENRKKRPDGNRLLERTWRRVLKQIRPDGIKLVVGGRSMGGRIASQIVAQGELVDGLALFAYPLHAPATPEKWRDAHLANIQVPTLFCSGTRDAFASPPELEVVTARMAESRLCLLEGADHGFRVLKSSGRNQEEVFDQATAALLEYHSVDPIPPPTDRR